ncbi:MAG: DUF5753 domain-containing protein [Actinocatenispora sp.]
MAAERDPIERPMGGRHAGSLQQYFVLEPRRLRRAVTSGQAQTTAPGQTQVAERLNYYDTTPSGAVEAVPYQPAPHEPITAPEPVSGPDELDSDYPLPELLPSPEDDVHPGWFHSYVTLEAEAQAIQEFEIQVVPGLFQTEDYGRAVLRTAWPPKPADDTERRLRDRLARQEILDRANPPLLTAVLDESVLRRPVGGPAVMADQLRHLVEIAHRPFVKLHVLTYEQAATAPLNGAFVLLELPNQERLAYVEGSGTGRILPGAEDVERLAHTFQAMRGEALSASESVAMLDQIRRELYDRR